MVRPSRVVTCDDCAFACEGWPAFRRHQRDHEAGRVPKTYPQPVYKRFYYLRNREKLLAYETARRKRLWRTSRKYRESQKRKFRAWWAERSKDPEFRAAHAARVRAYYAREDLLVKRRAYDRDRRTLASWGERARRYNRQRGNRRLLGRVEARNAALRKCGRCGGPLRIAEIRARERIGPDRVIPGPWVGVLSWCDGPTCGGLGFPVHEPTMRWQLLGPARRRLAADPAHASWKKAWATRRAAAAARSVTPPA